MNIKIMTNKSIFALLISVAVIGFTASYILATTASISVVTDVYATGSNNESIRPPLPPVCAEGDIAWTNPFNLVTERSLALIRGDKAPMTMNTGIVLPAGEYEAHKYVSWDGYEGRSNASQINTEIWYAEIGTDRFPGTTKDIPEGVESGTTSGSLGSTTVSGGELVIVHPPTSDAGSVVPVGLCLRDITPEPEQDAGSIVVVKEVTEGSDSSKSFAFETTGEGFDGFSLSADEGSHNSDNLEPGEYSVFEVNPNGWTFEGVVCESSIEDEESADSIELDEGETVTCTFTNSEDAEEEEPETGLGSITVCKMIVDSENTIGDGSKLDGAFEIEGVEIIGHETVSDSTDVIPTSQFSTPLTLNANLIGDSEEDAECITYDGLEIGSYFYGEETITGEGWSLVGYNDQITVELESLEDFFEYSGELFTPDTGDDSERNMNADGHIVLTENRPHRTLVVLNTFTAEDGPEGEIHGTKFNNSNELGLSEWVIELYESEQLIATTTTDGDGNYWFMNLKDGDYFVCEVLQEGWTQVSPTLVEGMIECNDTVGYSLSLEENEVINDADFWNEQEDNGGGGGGLPDPTIIVDKVTDSPGEEEFEFEASWRENFFLSHIGEFTSVALATGTYSVQEINLPGLWKLDSVVCTSSLGGTEINTSIELEEHEIVTCVFSNVEFAGGGGFTGGGGRGGGGSTPEPEGEILAEQITLVPAGAPDTGVGGVMSMMEMTIAGFMLILISLGLAISAPKR